MTTRKFVEKKWNNIVYLNYNHINSNTNGFKLYTVLIDDDLSNKKYSYLMFLLMNETSCNMVTAFSIENDLKTQVYKKALKQKLKSEAAVLPKGKLLITFKHNNLYNNHKIITFGDRKCNYKKCLVPEYKYKKRYRCSGKLCLGTRKTKCNSRYCSRKHQKKDWKQQHHLICKKNRKKSKKRNISLI